MRTTRDSSLDPSSRVRPSTAFRPATLPEYLYGQNTKEKCPFLFRKNWSRANPKSKEHFSLVSAESARRWRDGSFVQLPLEKGSRKC
ncbi:MAG: hypothetical protein CO183_02560 [Candidatus Zambryskibacteria bacterium CG_4_9_14_3_um_filter_42_9]|uniref:Uncharacterized protein n=1 Tax=Candidatus Zambryskibacteria bacterium CG22_combo_CG10-13_8_21_14_all_42_17 TaxID=1975118 RepID=A0A2H0BDF5_9BACT|nr:MAG: hypothetical protein COX06_01915 [Candidatus Zambryskibacteria bacterium CG22_combo_CG10-13_8_21_14_all_42_17]PJA36680.1 MAG: hypothetical protein CO183_02560 [Candidatus Zambryskibacteria bacterium CG_4_9_14_3_um_filter_42_9]